MSSKHRHESSLSHTDLSTQPLNEKHHSRSSRLIFHSLVYGSNVGLLDWVTGNLRAGFLLFQSSANWWNAAIKPYEHFSFSHLHFLDDATSCCGHFQKLRLNLKPQDFFIIVKIMDKWQIHTWEVKVTVNSITVYKCLSSPSGSYCSLSAHPVHYTPTLKLCVYYRFKPRSQLSCCKYRWNGKGKASKQLFISAL